ncbi:cytochrome b562 [Pseudoalteromonas phenolica]|uniref:Cytochrome b562 n=1 Tax=Pseudoalteromonas phenolica TaxID=161398 RepID=A0A0S2K8D3_9GAMM|nr:cytochrome b562 [Pseudoalteromonas phenolica]ALO44614.1 hypothetical protein PP2015_4147 [Pseudoalteromonas phenolica]MBE0357646.1 hypothetical protein [Pseudoalteromonas phenolica O-BC30]
MKYLVLLLFSVNMFSFSSSAQTSDLSVTMKNIGHAYKKAVRSTDGKEIIIHIDEMIILIQKSKKANFKADLKEQSIEGLDKVITVLQESKRFVERGEITKAKAKLKKVDVLREKYHELHEPPSVWELLFG